MAATGLPAVLAGSRSGPQPLARWQVGLLILLLLAATAWARPLMLPDEGRYVGVAWEMLRSGDWLLPTLNGLPFFHKPPLFYWITAGAMSVFGNNPLAARAASLAGGWLAAYSLFVFASRWSGRRMARWSLVALLAQPLFYVGAQFANLDMLVAGLIAATILLLADATLSLERGLPHRRALLLAYVLAAAGVLAKGLIGLVLPALVIVAWLALRHRWRLIGKLLSLPGVLLFSAVAAPWFIAMELRFPDFLHYFFVVQHFQRFASGGFNNVQAFWFYPALLVLFWLPCLPWLVLTLRRAGSTAAADPALTSLMWSWVVVIVGFFSLPQSKLVGYVLPVLPALAWLVAAGFARTGGSSRLARRGWIGGMVVMFVLAVSSVIYLSVWPRPNSRTMAAELAARHKPAQPILMLDHYDFDLGFYAHLRHPVVVVDHWTDPQVHVVDNWRKEIADAAAFAPALAATLLIEPSRLRAALCAAPVSWVIGPTADDGRFPVLAQAAVVWTARGNSLWRIDLGNPAVSRALQCAETPNAG